MLELRPNCEWCDRDLPPNSEEARICTYECTYCCDCTDNILQNVCPTCGGGLTKRPIRPVGADGCQKDLGLSNRPPSNTRHHSEWTLKQVKAVTAKLVDIPPAER